MVFTHVLPLLPGLPHDVVQPLPGLLDVDVVDLLGGVDVVQVEVRVQGDEPEAAVVQLDRVVAA